MDTTRVFTTVRILQRGSIGKSRRMRTQHGTVTGKGCQYRGMADEDGEEFPHDEFSNDMLELMREDATQTIERSLRKHDAHQKKAIQMVQINGIVISILIAAASQVPLQTNFNTLLYVGPGFFLTSAVVAGVTLRGHNLAVGISPNQITRNIDSDLSKTQYFVWYFNEFYQEAITDISDKTSSRATIVKWSVYLFLAGLIVTTAGIIIRLEPSIPLYG